MDMSPNSVPTPVQELQEKNSSKDEMHKIELLSFDDDREILDCDKTAEKKLIHKFDLRIMPLFATVYFFSSLDRSIIGNAKVAGMNDDIGINDAQYSTAVSIVYATYLPVMLPGVWLMTRLKKPRYYLSAMITCWSLVCLFTMFANSYGSLLVCRLLLGLFEGSFFSCMVLITTDYFFPEELGRRIGYLFSASSLSSAFGGLIATGITKIHTGPLESWRYLYLIEGLLSLCAALWLFLRLPDTPFDMVKSEEEKQVFASRTQRRQLFMKNEGTKKGELLSACTDWKLFYSVIIQFCQDICLYGFSTFLPSILRSGLGFDKMKAQYLSVPVYLFGGLVFIVAAEASDRLKVRGAMMFGLNIFGIIGYILILAVHSNGVKYFACYLICFSLYTGTGINEAWLTSNTAPRLKRSNSIAINQTLGNIAGVVSGQVYRDSPKYVLGHAFTIGCLAVSCISCACCSYYLNKRNKINQRILETGIDDRKQKRKHGDDAPDFKFIL